MAEGLRPIEVFCCYSYADEKWLRRLEIHLTLLQRQGLISLWHDRRIVPGAEWAKAIDTYLETDLVILLLVSADFPASDYYYSVEGGPPQIELFACIKKCSQGQGHPGVARRQAHH